MNFNDYERVQDILMYLSTTFVLKFHVVLASKDKYGNRKFFYSEYKFQSKYPNYGNVVSIKRQFKYYITIEDLADYQNNVLISINEMPMLRSILTTAAKWLQDSSIFGQNPDGKLQILKDVQVQMDFGQYASGLLFEPIIIPMQDGTYSKGIRMCVNSERSYADIEFHNFMGFYELIRSIDMYSVACSIISSLPMTQEDTAINRSDIEQQNQEYRNNISKKGTSFFDK